MSSIRSLRGNLRATAATIGVAILGIVAVGCTSAKDGDDFLGYDWQVSAVYDDPSLPHALPPEVIPPSVVFGHVSYTGSSSCGEFGGTLSWLDANTVKFSDLEVLRQQDCSSSAAEFDRRLMEQLEDEVTMTVINGELRVSAVEEAPPGEAQSGFAAVTVGAGAR